MKKFLLMTLCFLLIFNTLSFAKSEVEITEKQLDYYLIKSGAKKDWLNIWDYNQKLEFYNKKIKILNVETKEFYKDSNNRLIEKSKFISVKKSSNGSTIKPTDLIVSHTFGGGVSKDGSKFCTVYANYFWYKTGSTKGDKIAISIPDGWEIISNSFKCVEKATGIKKYFGSDPTDFDKVGDANGRPYDIDFHGAVWSLTHKYKVWHAGWVRLDMKKTDPKAPNTVISKYIQNVGSSTSWAITWGPLSVSIAGNQTTNQATWQSSFDF